MYHISSYDFIKSSKYMLTGLGLLGLMFFFFLKSILMVTIHWLNTFLSELMDCYSSYSAEYSIEGLVVINFVLNIIGACIYLNHSSNWIYGYNIVVNTLITAAFGISYNFKSALFMLLPYFGLCLRYLLV